MDGLLATIRANWSVISAAPWAFITVTVVITGVVWLAVNLLKAKQLEDLRSENAALRERIQLRDDRAAEYERKLNGASPDEAHAKIEALESRLRSVEPRRLTEAQRQKLTEAMLPFAGQSIQIDADNDVHEAALLKDAFVRAFTSANWQVTQGSPTFVYEDLEKSPGFSLRISDAENPSPAEQAIIRELDALGFVYNLHTNPRGRAIRMVITARF